MALNTIRNLIKNAHLRSMLNDALRTVGINYKSRAKRDILREASKMTSPDLPLDVTPRSSFQVFHEPGNPLIKRGSEFEPDVQSALQALFFLDRLRGNRPRFFDIGANIGLHSLEVCHRFPEIEIVAFDPSPLSWKYMELTISYNRLNNISLERIALGEDDGVVDFYTWGNSSSGDSLRDTRRQQGIFLNMIKVPIRRLDNFPHGEDPTVIKMDCEGAETGILRGMKRIMSESRPLVVSEVYEKNYSEFGLSSQNVYETITQYDYTIHTIWFKPLSFHEFSALQNKGEENFILLPKELKLPHGK